MPLTSEYLDFLTRYEKFSPKAYWDSIGKVWTIGYGTTRYLNGVPVKEGDVITEPEAVNQLKGFYQRFMPTIKQQFSNWDKFPLQAKQGILSMAYRGGAKNFTYKSPKLARAVNDAYADGNLSEDEYRKILSEMTFDNKKGNLQDRVYRHAAMLGGLYDYSDNSNINTLGGRLNKATSTPYTNFPKEVFRTGSKWSNRLRAFTAERGADFMSRLRDLEIKLPDNMHYRQGNGVDIVYSSQVGVIKYPWWDIFKLSTPQKHIVDYSKDADAAYEKSVQYGDTIHVPQGVGKYFVKQYKLHYPNLK